MNIKLMRYIDYCLGIPLCFLISTLNLLIRCGKTPAKKHNYQKVIFVKLSEMGAIILAYPLLKRIKEEYLDAELFFITFKKNKPLFELLGGIIEEKNVFTIREDSLWLFISDSLRAIRRIRKERINIAFDLEFFSRFSAILTYLSKAGKTIGFYRYNFEGLYRGNFFSHNIQYNPLIHISKSYLSLLQVIKQPRKFTPELEERIEDNDIILPKFVPSQSVKENIGTKLKRIGVRIDDSKLILINPGEGNLPLREWPLENFIALSKRLLENLSNYIIVIGAKDTYRKAELFCNTLNNKNCINLVGQTTVAELLELFNISNLLIINDCGIAHLASLVSIKKFVIFGPESPHLFSPLGKNNWIVYSNLPCSPCLSVFNHRNSSCRDNKCLKAITPDDVYALINKSL